MQLSRTQYAVIGTLAFHLILLAVLNLAMIKKAPVTEQNSGIRVVFQEPESMEKILKAIEEEKQAEADEAAERRNIAVNENEKREKSEENFSRQRKEQIDREIYEDLKSLEKEVIEKRREQGKGVFEEKEPEKKEEKEAPEEKKGSDKAFKGKTNITYNLEGRHAVVDYNPVYLCEEGGKVVVTVKVNRSGKVMLTSIDKERSETLNYCLTEYAQKAAKNFTFNEDANKPMLQEGFISFHFVPQ